MQGRSLGGNRSERWYVVILSLIYWTLRRVLELVSLRLRSERCKWTGSRCVSSIRRARLLKRRRQAAKRNTRWWCAGGCIRRGPAATLTNAAREDRGACRWASRRLPLRIRSSGAAARLGPARVPARVPNQERDRRPPRARNAAHCGSLGAPVRSCSPKPDTGCASTVATA
jgi:hypothetical protein